MTITVIINGVDTEITLTPDQVASIEAQSKPKFQWDYPMGQTYGVMHTRITSGWQGDDHKLLEYGRYRLTKETAEQSFARNIRANRLEALAEQLGGLIEFDPKASDNFFIGYSSKENKWNINNWNILFAEVVYMTEDCATEICRMLNEGEFSLDGEL